MDSVDSESSGSSTSEVAKALASAWSGDRAREAMLEAFARAFGRVDLSEDARQSLQIAVLTAWPRFCEKHGFEVTDTVQFELWCKTVIRNYLKRQYRKRRQDGIRDATWMRNAAELDKEEPLVARRQHRDNIDAVVEWRDRHTGLDREIIDSRAARRETFQALAERLKMPTSSVISRWSRLRGDGDQYVRAKRA